MVDGFSSRTDEPVRILLIVFNVVGQGTYWRAFHLGCELASRGHAVTLLATARAARVRFHEQVEAGVRVVEAPDMMSGSLRSGWDPWAVLCRVGWLAGRAFDLVHAFEARPVALAPALVAQRGGARLVMDWCDWLGRGGSVEERPSPLIRAVLRPVETFFEERFRRRADATTVINTVLAQRARALGVSAETITLIRNGSNVVVQPVDVRTARAQVGMPLDLPVIGFAGGTYLRDAALMAAALNAVHKVRPEVQLLLVGYFNRNIEAWLDYPRAVVRTGRIAMDAIYTHLAACDLCWLPLSNTGANRGRWPLKLNDYMAAACPVVATGVGDLASVVPQHQVGIIAPDDPQGFATATLALLDDPTLRASLGQAARRAAEGEFSWRYQADLLEAVYRRVISPSASTVGPSADTGEERTGQIQE